MFFHLDWAAASEIGHTTDEVLCEWAQEPCFGAQAAAGRELAPLVLTDSFRFHSAVCVRLPGSMVPGSTCCSEWMASVAELFKDIRIVVLVLSWETTEKSNVDTSNQSH